MKSLINKVLSFNGLAIAYVVLLLVWFLAWNFVGEIGLVMIVLNRVAVWLFLPAALLLGIALFKKRWKLAALQLIPAALFLILYSPYLIPGTGSRADGDLSSLLRMMTFNVNAGNENYSGIAQTIRRMDPDVVCLQEVTPSASNTLTGLLEDRYPWRHVGTRSTATGNCAIFSRIRPVQFEEILLDSSASAVVMTISTPAASHGRTQEGSSIAVVSAHLSGYQLRGKAPNSYGRHISEQTDFQQQEVRRLTFEVLKRKCSAILGIDANARETCFTYRILARNLTDAARKIGWRIGSSALPGTTRDIRINRMDYVFYTESGMEPVTVCRADDTAGSDHHPVVAEFYIKGIDVAMLKEEQSIKPASEMVSIDRR